MPLPPEALEPLLRLALVAGVGPQRLAALVRRFGSAEGALAARPHELEHLPGIGPAVARRVREASGHGASEAVVRALATLRRAGAVVVTPDDPAYPDAFRLVPDAPYLLYASGDLSLLGRPGIAVVGTRAPTPYGRAAAASLGGGLARAGLVVVSGMARGIDTAAHRAALEAGAPSIGVLGHGIEQVYPPENRPLFAAMRAGGLLLTEFPPGERPRAGNFPRRNRLITALGLGVLVIEMGARSGAQHTVSFALEQGRDVFAVPGPIGAPASEGTNQLLKEGARLVTSVDDVLEELRGVGSVPRRPADTGAAQRSLPLLSPAEARVADALSSDPLHVDELAPAAGMPAGVLLATLLELELELRGVVESLPGKLYRRAG